MYELNSVLKSYFCIRKITFISYYELNTKLSSLYARHINRRERGTLFQNVISAETLLKLFH